MLSRWELIWTVNTKIRPLLQDPQPLHQFPSRINLPEKGIVLKYQHLLGSPSDRVLNDSVSVLHTSLSLPTEPDVQDSN